ncbi:unnamed protein product [Cladocopium goreaui]|uniref:Ubiquitin-like domain-containing protein n=1 Tax=Cladocopium goreaui TaxID=2562237 RepID=A0A9P1CEL8_9DINO|nr:unnamed protein product [Cladocopium goreaui]
MDLLDVDGDCIQFLIDPKGRLREYVNGKLEMENVRWLRYDASRAMLTDEKGEITLQEKDRVEKALGVHCLAMRAGIQWLGDPPAPARTLLVEDTDGDRLEFLVNEDMKLQEFNNGELELEAVNSICFKFADGSITDDTGVFKFPPRECMQKVAALYSLALQVGIHWTGDNPQQVSAVAVGSEPKVLDIENCAGDWEFQCPQLWDALKPTDDPKKRYCETCRENVYFCDSIEEVQSHASQRRCVAFVSDTDVTMEAEAEDTITLRVALLSGQELPEVCVPAAATVRDVKQAITKVAGHPAEEQRLLLEGEELWDIQPISSFDVKVGLQLVRVLKPVVERPFEGRKVKMGKRRAPPRG